MIDNERICSIVEKQKDRIENCDTLELIGLCKLYKNGECTCDKAVILQSLNELLLYQEMGSVDEVRKLKSQLQEMKNRAEECGLNLE